MTLIYGNMACINKWFSLDLNTWFLSWPQEHRISHHRAEQITHTNAPGIILMSFSPLSHVLYLPSWAQQIAQVCTGYFIMEKKNVAFYINTPLLFHFLSFVLLYHYSLSSIISPPPTISVSLPSSSVVDLWTVKYKLWKREHHRIIWREGNVYERESLVYEEGWITTVMLSGLDLS